MESPSPQESDFLRQAQERSCPAVDVRTAAGKKKNAPPVLPPTTPPTFCISRVFWFRAVVDFVTVLARSKTLTVARLKRALNKAMAAHASPGSAPVPAPSALDVEAMFARMFADCSIPLSMADRKLDSGAVAARHRTSCSLSRDSSFVHPSCYMATMIQCLSHGWAPPVDLSAAAGSSFWTRFRGNHLSASLFPGFVSSQVSTLLASGVVSEASEIFCTYSPLLLNPLGVVFALPIVPGPALVFAPRSLRRRTSTPSTSPSPPQVTSS